MQQRGLTAGRELDAILTTVYLGLGAGYLACGFAVRLLSRKMATATARRAVFAAAAALMLLSAVIPGMGSLRAVTAALVLVNFGVAMWIAMYLTMAQEVSASHVSTAAGLLGGSGSLAGAVAMWAVGRVSQASSNFSAPFAAVAVAGVLAAAAGLAVTRAPR